MKQDLDIRALSVGNLGALTRLFLRMLAPAAIEQIEALITRLLGSRPVYGALHTLFAEDVERDAVTHIVGIPTSAYRELIHVTARVTPWTPICDVCGDYPLSSMGGKVSELLDGAACPFCRTGHFKTPVTLLRRLNWATGELMDPEIVDDHRAVSGARVPLVDASIREWVGTINPAILVVCQEQDVPLYGVLAYANLRMHLFSELEEAHDFLTDKQAQRENVEFMIKQAKRFLLERELWTVEKNVRHYNGRPLNDLPVILFGQRRFFVLDKIGRGSKCDVFRCRTEDPASETFVVKVLTAPNDMNLLEREFHNLQRLAGSDEKGTELFRKTIPWHVQFGPAQCFDGIVRPALVYHYDDGFDWTLADVLNEYPEGVDGRTSVWLGKRMFLVLSWVHDSGLTHEAGLPEHWLINPADHIVSLRDFSYATSGRDTIFSRAIVSSAQSFYPVSVWNGGQATEKTDTEMVCRCLIAVLGGDPEQGILPATVPQELQQFLCTYAGLSGDYKALGAFALHEELTRVAKRCYGDRKFVVLLMPNTTGKLYQEVV